MQRFSASRSAVPRVTGKPPSSDSNLPNHLLLHHLSAPMKRIRRRVTPEQIGVSRMLRCVGARMKMPSAGTFSRPSTFIRHHSRQNPVTRLRTMKYAIWCDQVSCSASLVSILVMPCSSRRRMWSSTSSIVQAGGVDDGGASRLGERTVRPGAVVVVAGSDGALDLVDVAAGLGHPPFGADARRRGEVQLQLGVGEDHRSDVATLDHAAARARRPTACWRSRSSARTPLFAATLLTAAVTSGVRMAAVASTPSTNTPRSPTSSVEPPGERRRPRPSSSSGTSRASRRT